MDNSISAGTAIDDGYRSYVIWLLFSVYVLNYVDRQMLSVLLQPIKQEYGFSDLQLGLLGGLAFALLYSTLGIPIARLADRASRVTIIVVSLLVWSTFTVLTGFADSFLQFAVARVCVGVGEAGCSPAAYSLISDYFPAARRSTALSIYAMGIYAGILVGMLVGASVAQAFGWRAAFWCVGLPGIAMAWLVKATLHEPAREGGKSAPQMSAVRVLSSLWALASFRHTTIAAALHTFAAYGVGTFFPAFMQRTYHMTLAQVGGTLALVTGLGGLCGTYAGGIIADRLSKSRRDARYQLWVPALSTVVLCPLGLLLALAPGTSIALVLLVLVTALGAMYLGPTFALTQSLAAPSQRALAGALMLLVINLVGLGLGPLLTGAISDALQRRLLAAGVDELSAGADGLRWALGLVSFVNLWSTLHYLWGARSLPPELTR